MYGQTIDRYEGQPRSVIGPPETSAVGNVILRVGRENEPLFESWHQTEHVVMTKEEARALAGELTRIEGAQARLASDTADTLESGLDILEEHLDEYDDDDRKALEAKINRARTVLADL